MNEPPLVTHLALFGHALRQRGARVGLSDEADGLEALTLVDVVDRDEVRRALRVSLKIQPRDLAAFEELFARFWESVEEPAGGPMPWPAASVPTRLTPGDGRPSGKAEPGREREVPTGEAIGYSPEAVLRAKPFVDCSAADLAAMERLMARLVLRVATRPSRRLVPSRGPGVPDLRRSLRKALAHGGEILTLARRRRAVERPRLVVLCDTSGSMDPHARFLLAFVLALRRVASRSEIFAFNTTLVRLTPWLRPGQVDLTLARLASGVPDWSGGTRIGECLAVFEEHYLPTLVDSKTVVLILSDGLDRGDLAPLTGAMRSIRARARRVLWLNPLAGDPRYEPTARAMAAALPFVDRLLPAHNLDSLARLLPLLTA